MIGDVGGADVVDFLAAALAQELPEAREVASIPLERVGGQSALDFAVVEERIDRLVEGQTARHILDSTTKRQTQQVNARLQSWPGAAIVPASARDGPSEDSMDF